MSYATDDGVGLHYVDTELAEAVTAQDGKAGFVVERGADGSAVETPLPTRLVG
jgi:hypothetical protein